MKEHKGNFTGNKHSEKTKKKISESAKQAKLCFDTYFQCRRKATI